MKKWGFLFLCLLLLLAGYSQGEATELEEKEKEAEEISTDLSERHLPLYEMLEHYNEYDYFDGFTVSETERGGRLSYQFTRQDADVRLLMDETGEAELSIGGETTTFTAAFIPVNLTPPIPPSPASSSMTPLSGASVPRPAPRPGLTIDPSVKRKNEPPLLRDERRGRTYV